MLLQSPETQELKYKKETITTFRIPSTPFYPKVSQNPTDDMALFCLYMMHPLTKFFPSKMTCLHCHFLLEYSSVFLYYALDTVLQFGLH